MMCKKEIVIPVVTLIAVVILAYMKAILLAISGLDANQIIATTSVIAVILTLWANLRESKKNREERIEKRKHDRLSVKPLLRTPRFSITEKGLTNAKIKLVNSGVGPAIIETFVLLFKGEEVARNNNNAYKKFLFGNNIKELNCMQVTHRNRHSVIAAGEELILCEFEYIDKIENDKIFNKLRFQIDYYSIYKDELFTFPPEDEEE